MTTNDISIDDLIAPCGDEGLNEATCPHSDDPIPESRVALSSGQLGEIRERVARAIARADRGCGCGGCTSVSWDLAVAAVDAMQLSEPAEEWKRAAARHSYSGKSQGARQASFIAGAKHAATFLHVNPSTDATRIREAQAVALEEAADDWLKGVWVTRPRHKDRSRDILAGNLFPGNWLRARAASIRTNEGTTDDSQ